VEEEMFCPKCASQNLDGASFCRTCGANISLVSQAMTGELAITPESEPEDRLSRRQRKRQGRELKLDHAFKNIFMGIAFLLVAIALAFSIGKFWWFWMLIPAFSMLGTGIAQFIRIKEGQKKQSQNGIPAQQIPPSLYPPVTASRLPPRNTGEMVAPPPSVTEGTTRHLGAEAPTRHLDASGDPQK
jgi:hypothetical protein